MSGSNVDIFIKDYINLNQKNVIIQTKTTAVATTEFLKASLRRQCALSSALS